MTAKKPDVFTTILACLVWVAIFAAIVGIRLLIVGGDWTCFWAQDVGLCMAVNGSGS